MTSRRFLLTTLVLPVLLLIGCSESKEPADLVLKGGKIVTVDETNPEVQALAVKGDRILSIGTDSEISGHIGPETKVIDLGGRLATPGFIEGHGHFMGIGNARMILDLTKPRNWDEIVALVAEAVERAEPGEWIRGRGWHQEKWDTVPDPAIEGIPTHASLSAVSPDNPVALTHASGHASLVNAKAMELAGIKRSTPDPAGGEILRDKRGRATGFLRETAQGLARRADSGPATPEERDTLARKVAELAAQECLSKGITSFQDAGSGFGTIDLFRTLVDEGKMPLRLWVMIRASNEELAEKLPQYRTVGYGDGRLTVRAIKLSIDGALGSRGAWLLEPYSDAPHLSGLNLIPLDSVRETARLAMENDYQLCIHAIGDKGNQEVLNVFEESYNANPDKSNPRWRVEHAQHLHLDDIPRFADLDVIASMQGVHCTSDGPWVPERLGDQRSMEGAYVWQKLMKSGAVVTNGTDAPVEDVSPIASYYSTVSRRLADGSVFYGNERMSRMEALRSYTVNAAYSAFEEDQKGSLMPGLLADIVVLSQDILTIPEAQIPETKVDLTIVGGKVEFERQQ